MAVHAATHAYTQPHTAVHPIMDGDAASPAKLEKLINPAAMTILYPSRVARDKYALTNGFKLRTHMSTTEKQSMVLLANKEFDKLSDYEWLTTPSHRATTNVDFTLENPLGKLWLLDSVREFYDPEFKFPWEDDAPSKEKDAWRAWLLDLNKQFRLTGKYGCVMLKTTYCKYGTAYRKPTAILTSLATAFLSTACQKTTPCEFTAGKWPRHPTTVQKQSQDMRNQLPIELVFELLDAFVARHRTLGARIFLCIDVFSGWGSFSHAVEVYAMTRLAPYERMLVYTNDIKKRGEKKPKLDMDVKTDCSLVAILRFALLALQVEMDNALHVSHSNLRSMENFYTLEQKLCQDTKDRELSRASYYSDELADALKQAGVAVLFHLSFPCTTYSTAAGSTHRESKCLTPKTPLAHAHDTLLKQVLAQLVTICHLRPCDSPGPTA